MNHAVDKYFRYITDYSVDTASLPIFQFQAICLEQGWADYNTLIDEFIKYTMDLGLTRILGLAHVAPIYNDASQREDLKIKCYFESAKIIIYIAFELTAENMTGNLTVDIVDYTYNPNRPYAKVHNWYFQLIGESDFDITEDLKRAEKQISVHWPNAA